MKGDIENLLIELFTTSVQAKVMRAVLFTFIGFMLILLAGCRNEEKEPQPYLSTVSEQGHLNHAQPKLPTLKLYIGQQVIEAEIAVTPVQIQTGMMFREKIGETEGMLFVLPYPHKASFYMKNTIIPLSCAYIDADGIILEIHDLKPLDETPVQAASDNVYYVLETAQGWFTKNGIKPGMTVSTEVGSLEKTFRSKRQN